MQDKFTEPVILSKLGFGYSDSRKRTECVYVAFVQFRPRPDAPPKMLTMALRAAMKPKAGEKENIELDAHMATAVAQIIRRFV